MARRRRGEVGWLSPGRPDTGRARRQNAKPLPESDVRPYRAASLPAWRWTAPPRWAAGCAVPCSPSSGKGAEAGNAGRFSEGPWQAPGVQLSAGRSLAGHRGRPRPGRGGRRGLDAPGNHTGISGHTRGGATAGLLGSRQGYSLLQSGPGLACRRLQ